MKVNAPTLAPILRSDAQGRILARVLIDPEKSHSLSDLVDSTDTSMPTVLREVLRAEEAGILITEKIGPIRQVCARVDHPLYDAVRRIILATYGPPTVVAEEFANLEGAEAVLLIGSWAARYLGEAGRSPNDIDVLVIGDADRDLADGAAARAEERIGMPVQATVRALSQWKTERGSFIQEVKSRPLVAILVNDEQEFGQELRELEVRGSRSP
ncbi:MAG: ArsR family transcriptional regulator [bacterium]|nr:ArsR family transcriptional regulator [bacterium]MCY4133761.1 ArsR family transcriptional regulator [bacterium]